MADLTPEETKMYEDYFASQDNSIPSNNQSLMGQDNKDTSYPSNLRIANLDAPSTLSDADRTRIDAPKISDEQALQNRHGDEPPMDIVDLAQRQAGLSVPTLSQGAKPQSLSDMDTNQLKDMLDAVKQVPSSGNTPLPRSSMPNNQSNPIIDKNTQKQSMMDQQSFTPNISALLAAQENQRQYQLGSAIMSGAADIQSGLLHTNPNYGAAEMLQQSGAQGIQNVKDIQSAKQEQMKMATEGINFQKAQMELGDIKAESDPNSEISKTFRELAKQMNLKIGADTTAAQIKKAMPAIEMKFKIEEMKAQKAEKSSNSANEKDTKRLDHLNEKITSEIASGRSAFGVAARNKQAVENAGALFQGNQDLNTLDNRQAYEVAKVMDRVLSQGAPTIRGSDHFNIQTAKSWIAGKMEQVTNKRQEAGLGSFLNTMKDTLNREGQIADQQIKSAQGELIASYGDLAEKDSTKEKMALILEKHGLSPDIFKKGSSNNNSEENVRIVAIKDDPTHGIKAGQQAMVPKKNLQKALNSGLYTQVQ